MAKMTQSHFNHIHNSVRSLLHRSGFAIAHVEEVASLLLMECAIEVHQGNRAKASAYLIDKSYQLGARIRDPGRTDVKRGEFKAGRWGRFVQWLSRHVRGARALEAEGAASGVAYDPGTEGQTGEESKIAEVKPRILMPVPSSRRRR